MLVSYQIAVYNLLNVNPNIIDNELKEVYSLIELEIFLFYSASFVTIQTTKRDRKEETLLQ